MKLKITKVDLTYDQCKERQAIWRKRCAEDFKMSMSDVSDAVLLNWISLNFHVIRKVSYLEEL